MELYSRTGFSDSPCMGKKMTKNTFRNKFLINLVYHFLSQIRNEDKNSTEMLLCVGS